MSDKLKILVVDDQRIIGDLFEITLGYRGHQITVVENPEKALDIIREGQFDVVFLDIVMPQKDGVEVLKDIKRFYPQISVVMMSGYSVDEKYNQAVELGAVMCLKKPFEWEDIKGAVKKAIGKEI